MNHLKLYKDYKINEGLLTTTVLTGASIYFLIRFIKGHLAYKQHKNNERQTFLLILDLFKDSHNIQLEEDDINIKFIFDVKDENIGFSLFEINKEKNKLTVYAANGSKFRTINVDDDFIRKMKKVIVNNLY